MDEELKKMRSELDQWSKRLLQEMGLLKSQLEKKIDEMEKMTEGPAQGKGTEQTPSKPPSQKGFKEVFKCSDCGNEVDSDAAVCSKCGAKFTG